MHGRIRFQTTRNYRSWEYIESRVEGEKMSLSNNISYLKSKAVEYWQTQPILDRLAIADWQSYGKQLGVIYHGIVRIWVLPNGKIMANKPSVRELLR